MCTDRVARQLNDSSSSWLISKMSTENQIWAVRVKEKEKLLFFKEIYQSSG